MKIIDETLQLGTEQSMDVDRYTHVWEYYRDELCRLDAKIACLLDRVPAVEHLGEVDPLQSFKGLVITKEEAERLIAAESDRDQQMKQMGDHCQQREAWDQIIETRKNKSISNGTFLPLVYLTEQFHLTAFEEHCLLTCLAVELDRKYEKLFAYLLDDVQQKYPTVDLMIKLHFDTFEEQVSALEYFAPDGKLMTYFFNQDPAHAGQPLLSRRLYLDERITRFLVHVQEEDEQLKQFTKCVRPTDELAPLVFDTQIQERIQTYLSELIAAGDGGELNTVLYFKGKEGSGRKLHVKHICRRFNQSVLIVDLEGMLRESIDLKKTLNRVFREAILQQAVLCFSNFDTVLGDEQDQSNLHLVIELIKRFKGVVFLLAEKGWKPLDLLEGHTFLQVELPLPPEKESEHFWELLGKDVAAEVDWGNMASKFRFTPGQIVRTIQTVRSRTAWLANQKGRVTEEAIVEAAYEQVKHRLEKKAKRLIPSYTWESLILPKDQKDQLRMACNQIRYRHTVFDQWGFHRRVTYGKGVSMLFSGPPGTGKTMAAEVVAKELLLEIYKIDLSQVISKYIGETEKNLNEIFGEAQYSNSILFFDETDALFGKRSEVKDSKDKYANIEVAYLLQKMEEYQGITVLATNLLQNIDEAFMRRINYVIKFPFPDAEYREKIWKSMFPEDAPLATDVDFQYIAEKLEVAGGNIKNIALSAAFLAAAAKEEIQMKHIIKAARHELQKMGKILLKEDFGDFWD